MPVYPWRRWVRLIPETYTVHLGRAFSGEIGRFIGVFLIDPGHTALDLFQVGIRPTDPDLAHRAAVLVGIGDLDFYLLAEYQVGEALLGGLPEVLLLLGSVDLVEPDLDLPIAGIEERDGIAIRNPHDPTRKVGLGYQWQQQGQEDGDLAHGRREFICENVTVHPSLVPEPPPEGLDDDHGGIVRVNGREVWYVGGILSLDPLAIQQQGAVVTPQAELVADDLSESEVQADQVIFFNLGDADLVRLAELEHELLDGFLDGARVFMLHK